MKLEERKQLDALSKLLTGKSSAWNKSMKQGHRTPMEETLEDGTIRKYIGIKYPTLAEVKEEMDKALKEKVLKEKLEADKKAAAEKANVEDQKILDEQEKTKKLNEALADPNVKAEVPGTGQTMDELRREGIYE
jgi:hypothetical protein